MALGDFRVDSANRGDISIEGTDGIFGVLEAKMGSQLSAGTKNAPDYDQASRNLACIAYNTKSTKHAIFFAVVAPQKKIEEYKIGEQVSISRMIDKISKRFDMYDSNSNIYSIKEVVLERARSCTCFTLSYESWLDALVDHAAYSVLDEFRNQCYKFNRIG
ncbi:MAG: hypothetical protein JW817_00025 [Clostridiales bacterium]|nr:hypothetical protein [Clostridiales bacterium]